MIHRQWPCLFFSLILLTCLSGCETTDKMLGAAERAVGSNSGRTVLDIVGARIQLKSRDDEWNIMDETPRHCCGTFAQFNAMSRP